MNINQTLLALQVLNGMRFYKARVQRPSDFGKFTFHVKSMTIVEVNSCHIIEQAGNFGVCRVLEEVEYDFSDDAVLVPTLLLPIADPLIAYEADCNFTKMAKTRMAKAQALQSARAMLAEAGFDLTILQVEGTK